MSYDIKVLNLPIQNNLVMRTVTPVEKLPDFLGKAYGSIMQFLESKGIQPTGMPFTAYYNMDMSALDIAAGFPVLEKMEADGEILNEVIPAGKFLSTIYEGPYADCSQAYEALQYYLDANALKATGVAYEYYLNDPSSGPEIIPLTEIRFPLK